MTLSFLQIIQITIILLLILLLLILAVFFFMIFRKCHAERKFQFYYQQLRPAVLEFLDAGLPLRPLSSYEQRIALQIILDQAELRHADFSPAILALHLDPILTQALKKQSNRILAIKNLGLSHIPQAYACLKPFWSSRDFDESYFSLYYTLDAVRTESENKELLSAILKADFSPERKTEMIRRLEFSNEFMIELLNTAETDKQAVLIASLNASMLDSIQLKNLEILARSDLSLQIALVLLLIRSDQDAALPVLKEYITPEMPIALRVEVAYRLSESRKLSHLELLKQLLSDSSWEVRYHTALNLMNFGPQGLAFLKEVSSNNMTSEAGQMAQLHLSISPETA